MNVEELRRQVAEQRERLSQLEAKLRQVEREERDRKWFPRGFYAAYYVLSGMLLGVIASWVTLLVNIVGAALVEGDALKLLRVYATILGGAKTLESSSAVILVFALGIHTLTGAVCGAPIHVVYSRYFMGQSLVPRLATAVVLGVIMWVVNFYGILSWFQPMLLGVESSYIVENVPIPVAAGSHVVFTVVVLLMQPLAVFNTRNYPGGVVVPAPSAQEP